MCFNPRSPRGGATALAQKPCRQGSVSIHAPREGERPAGNCWRWHYLTVSIHAPREGERPPRRVYPRRGAWCFNPRSPRGGATRHGIRTWRDSCKFQSTLPARGSDTVYPTCKGKENICFNPRSPRGGATPFSASILDSGISFNPRSPRGGATCRRWKRRIKSHMFQSTLPARGSDPRAIPSNARAAVSIHAPREGERPYTCSGSAARRKFQSTLPARGSDPRRFHAHNCKQVFQSTLPARGSDRM